MAQTHICTQMGCSGVCYYTIHVCYLNAVQGVINAFKTCGHFFHIFHVHVMLPSNAGETMDKPINPLGF